MDKNFDFVSFNSGRKIDVSNEEAFYYLTEGAVKISFHDKDSQRILTVLTAGNVYGNFQFTCPYVVDPIDNVSAYRVTKEKLELITTQDPDLFIHLVTSISETIFLIERQLLILAKLSVRERVSGVLLFLYDIFGCKSDSVDSSIIFLDKTTIADLSNTTIETLSRCLTDFESQGIIKRLGSYVAVLNTEKLKKFT